VASKAKSRTPPVVERFHGTVLERPAAALDKAYFASVGLADRFWAGFGTRFDELASDGEEVRRCAIAEAESLRQDVLSNVDTARKNVIKRADQVLERILSVSPVATTNDVDALNAKLDKVTAAVARQGA
jgi:polyhydroxyalkanoate synthesis regulator phasin